MIDFNDWKHSSNKFNKFKLYRTYCDSCGIDKGYKKKYESKKLCRSCAMLKRHSNNYSDVLGVNWEDYIIKQEKKCSRKLYKCYCINCGVDRGYQCRNRILKHNKTHMCRSCASLIIHKDKEVSNITKQKMSDNHHLNNGGTHSMLGKHHSEETKAKLSAATVKQLKTYNRTNYNYNGINGEINMRSSWEVKYAEYLDNHGINWEYEPEFKLSIQRIYVPDFKLEDGTVIEIKGYWRSDAKEKWDCFCKDYPTVNKKVLMKSDLQALGIEL